MKKKHIIYVSPSKKDNLSIANPKLVSSSTFVKSGKLNFKGNTNLRYEIEDLTTPKKLDREEFGEESGSVKKAPVPISQHSGKSNGSLRYGSGRKSFKMVKNLADIPVISVGNSSKNSKNSGTTNEESGLGTEIISFYSPEEYIERNKNRSGMFGLGEQYSTLNNKE